MGQGASTQRDEQEHSRRDGRRFSRLVRDRDEWPAGNSLQDGGASSSFGGMGGYRPEQSRSTQPLATFRRQISAQSESLRGTTGGTERSTSTHDEVLFEQEERPLVNMEDLRMRDAPITHITASPMPRRPSVMSRLGSRLLPRYIPTGHSGVDEEDTRPRRVLRRRLSDSAPQQGDENADTRSHRFSMLGSLSGSDPSTSTQSSPRRHLAPISRPIPLMADGSMAPPGLASSSLHTLNPDPPPSFHPRGSGTGLSSGSRRSSLRNQRLSRVRRSITSPLETLENMFSNSSSQSTGDRQTSVPPRRPSRAAMADETDYLLPPLNIADTSLDMEEPLNGGVADHGRTDAISPASDPSDRSTWTQRWADRAPTVRHLGRDARRVPNLLRGRSSRLIRRDDEAPLSRILQLAAAAIAAQLAGSTEGISDMEAVGDDNFDGSLNTFMETLNNAAGSATPTHESQATLAALPPLNFWRVFRFVNSRPASRDAANANRDPGARSTRLSAVRDLPGGAIRGQEDLADGRTVTLVVVGVRSVPTSSLNRDPGEGADANLDTLLSLPVSPATAPRMGNGGGLLRHANGRSRFSPRRRASVGGVTPFPAQYDSQRHQRVSSSSGPTSGTTTPVSAAANPMVLSESPPGPHPPPSTPSDPYLSAQPSGNTTPSRRPSSASAAQPPQGLHRDSLERRHENHDPIPAHDPSAQGPQQVRQRRRSDSEYARHGDLGAGAARRNGVVEPDTHQNLGAGSSRRNGVVEPDDAPAQGRSWLIYVVGTNLSEDHPAFATPSLFTDNPTYEDMLLLSSLLGPAKPPVASREDVASSLGVYRIRWRNLDGNLHASAIDAQGELQITPTERCLVCLCEYELLEDVRKLSKCAHVFHRECIDTWLTTGRNSCPLCRGAGVDEKTASSRSGPSPERTNEIGSDL